MESSRRRILRGVSCATTITHAGDYSGRLFVTQQFGRVLIFNGESFLRVACHPSYPSNGYSFVNCNDVNGGTAGSRFTVTTDAGVDASRSASYNGRDIPDLLMSAHIGGDGERCFRVGTISAAVRRKPRQSAKGGAPILYGIAASPYDSRRCCW